MVRGAVVLVTAFPGLTLLAVGETKETTDKEPLTTVRTNVAQPGADKIPAIPTIPIPTIPMERLIPAKCSGKENRPYNSSTTKTLQYTHTSKSGAGQSLDVNEKSLTASPRKAQSGTGPPSKISALPRPRGSMLPAPRKSLLPSLAKDAVDDDGSVSSGGWIGDLLL